MASSWSSPRASSGGSTGSAGGGDHQYSWHLSLRADRPVENCPIRPHAYMYGKKLDTTTVTSSSSSSLPDTGSSSGGNNNNASSSSNNNNHNHHHHNAHSKTSKEPPPAHEFSYRWFRSAHVYEPCASQTCPRRTSFSPHDWSSFALQNYGKTRRTDISSHSSSANNFTTTPPTSLQCVSAQSSLYKSIFCNAHCFREAWKTQYTIPPAPPAGGASNNNNNSTTTPTIHRTRSSGSVGSHDDMMSADETASVRSTGSSSYGGGDLTPTHTPRGNIPHSSGPPSRQYNVRRHYSGGMDHLNGAGGSWVEVSRDQIYLPGPDDVGHKLKIEAAAYRTDEPREMLMSRVCKTDVVLGRAPVPPSRVHMTAKGTSSAGSNGPRFRVATYNVLAEIYATQQQYPYCDFWALSWDFRFANILAQILDAHADIICLQEIQADHYENHVYASLSDAGYEGVFKQKTRQSMGLAGKVDGCALFWKRTKFHMVESYGIEFNEVAQRQATQVLGLNLRSEEGVAFLNRLSRDNVAQLVVLEIIPAPGARPPSGREVHQICMANTHLYSHKDFPDVKLWQSWQLLQELESFVMNRGTNLPLILCGDFNSTPDTAVYDLLSRQQVHPGHPDMNAAAQAGDGEGANVLPDAMNITHSFQLGSAYNTVLGQEPWVTNYTVHFKGVLDYIWYSAPHLRPLSVAPIPSRSELTRYGPALPNTEYSSDHVMLIADFQIINSSGR